MPSSKQKNASQSDSSQLTFALIASVVAIIIFASPAFTASATARRSAEATNLGEVAKTYDAYIHAGNTTRTLTVQPGGTAQAVAVIFARLGQLNDGTIWFVKSDPKLNGSSAPSTVLSGDSNSSPINPDFANKTLSYEIAANITFPPPPAPQSSPPNIPVAWTRGLRDDGTWAPDSPWLGEGGHIAFLDGHVQWFNKLSVLPGAVSLYKYGTTTPTTNIQEALPPGATILGAEPGQTGP